jgi:CheY-like chemotaxis protein
MNPIQINAGHGLTSPNTQSVSVVVLDVSPLSLLALAGVLDGHGYGCICARTGDAAIEALAMGRQDMIVADVGDDAAAMLDVVDQVRAVAGYADLPAVLIADAKWAGLEKKCEAKFIATRCLFKPIDSNSLIAVVEQTLWLPTLVAAHRRRGSRPNRLGWVSL